MLNLKDTLDGYLKNVEVIGNTVQDTNNLADIRSVGDKVEGQELYKIDVVSCGKNLYNPNKVIIGNITENGDFQSVNNQILSDFIQVKSNNYYIHSLQSSDYVVNGFIGYDSNKNFVRFLRTSVDIIDENIKFVRVRFRKNNSNPITIDDVHIAKPQLEEGRIITAYEPYQEQKLEILSPVQLEKVGDVADRIICKDGVWGIEKHIKTVVFNGSEDWSSQNWGDTSVDHLAYKLTLLDVKDFGWNDVKATWIICDTFIPNYSIVSCEIEGITKLQANQILAIKLHKDKAPNITEFKSYLSKNNILVKYILAEPRFIPLPHDQQVKLRTFAGQTNIAFLTEIPGQIKAQVPKSLGATVNTHTEQITDLYNSLDRVKKLEETTVSTIETERSLTTVDETSNGYFEDVKLEGKTLVNLNQGQIDMSKGEISVINVYPKGDYTDFEFVSGDWAGYNGTIDISNKKQITFICEGSGYSNDARTFAIKLRDVNNTTLRTIYVKCNGLNVTLIEPKPNEVILTIDRTFEIGKTVRWRKDIVLEGDHTNNPPEYFEGLMSVGQDVEEVSVESVDGEGNLFDSNFWELGFISDSSGVYSDIDSYVRTKKIRVSPNTLYTFKGYTNRIYYYDANGNFISRIDIGKGTFLEQTNSFTTPSNCVYIALRYALSVSGSVITSLSMMKQYNTVICKGTLNGDLVYQSNKKPLLYFNPTTETWEKPVLREWDTIEKHSDGKYYYHKRSNEMILNGSENAWNIRTDREMEDTQMFTCNIGGDFITNGNDTNLISDKFNPTIDTFAKNIEGFYRINGYMYLRILKSKLTTQDVSGFKAWLQANNITVVYQLAQEEVYECTNIDLMTYSGETNYIINSGVISPKSLLKVHNNIANVVKILQEKVSLLENTFIAGLKSVLSGDMYSLATILYPEDFIQNDNTEQDIMVIPE